MRLLPEIPPAVSQRVSGIVLLCCGLLGPSAAAQTAPVQSSAPAQTPPVLQITRGLPTGAPGQAPASPSRNSTISDATFGNPRINTGSAETRVVFDLAAGVTYRLTPTPEGLRIDVFGAQVVTGVRAALGPGVTGYQASGSQVLLATPYPLTPANGWRASEATLGSGARVLIVDLGPVLTGGAGASLRALAPSSSATARPLAQGVLTVPNARVTGSVGTNSSSGPVVSQPPLPEGVTPSDVVSGTTGVTPPPLPPPLPGQQAGQSSALGGQAQGTLQVGAALTPPRLGKSPGLTRVVLDLPPGTRYQMVPGGVSLRVHLTGVTAAARSVLDISPEVRGWRYEPTSEGVTVTLLTGTPLTDRSGWRAQLLAPLTGSDRSRLAIDLSPALADLTPLTPQERVLATVPPLQPPPGLGILAFGAGLVKPRVVIDPGHGGHDPGGIGAVVEKQVALDVSLRVRDLLRAAGVDVVMTRETDRELVLDKATDLNMRAAMGTPGTQLFLSVHVNALAPESALRGYGVETWWNPNHPLSNSFAAIIQKNVIAVTGAYSDGLKNNRSLAVLRNSRIPAALIEIGYTSHPVDGLNLKDSNYLDRVALGIAQGIREALVTGFTGNGVDGNGN